MVPERSQVSGRPLTPFGAWVAGEINRRGWTQSRFAAESEISDSALSTWLYVPNRLPDLRSCARIAAALGMPLYRVLEAAGLPSDGLAGYPRDSVRRAILGHVERMCDDEAADLLRMLECRSR